MTVICQIQPCPFRNSSGFCRNKLVSINNQGVCKHLTLQNWQENIDKKFMDGYQIDKEKNQENE